jgi:hypothetical protein
MTMQVKNRLSSTRTIVHTKPVAGLRHPNLLGYISSRKQQTA